MYNLKLPNFNCFTAAPSLNRLKLHKQPQQPTALLKAAPLLNTCRLYFPNITCPSFKIRFILNKFYITTSLKKAAHTLKYIDQFSIILLATFTTGLIFVRRSNQDRLDKSRSALAVARLKIITIGNNL